MTSLLKIAPGPREVDYRSAVLAAGAIPLLAVCGIAIALHTTAGIAAVFASFLVFAALWPTITPLACLFTIVAAHSQYLLPTLPGLGQDGVQKVLLLALVGVLLLREDKRFSLTATLAILLFGSFAMYGVLFAPSASGIDQATLFRALMGFSFAWIVLFVRLTPKDARTMLFAIAALPAVSLAYGAGLRVLGYSALFQDEYTGVIRLSGASIPAHLAMLSFVGVIAGLAYGIMFRESSISTSMVILNILVCCASLTRGAIAATVVLLATFVCAIWVSQRRKSPEVFISSVALNQTRAGLYGFALIIVAGVAILPLLLQRSRSTALERGFNSSGRDEAWSFYFDQFSANPAFGNGLGFASVANEILKPTGVQSAFRAPHNEYLHFLVDVGLIGSIGLAVIMVVGLIRLVRRMTSPVMIGLILAVALSVVVYAYFDNIFSTPQFLLPMLLTLMCIGSVSGRDFGKACNADPARGV
ncbi:O-antigen ligase family protein [Gordonia sp. 4N]|uniref:O-antigen ligase family protein n=1 Tax=Gordonia sp. 4N TaxID=2993508 RepID=UPI002248FAAE|nr:O-antigen ligase family protein [Gordonia sp. 4N]MCX2755478.1 O-antigen ligase family protein [Gordonia sp. 4N]